MQELTFSYVQSSLTTHGTSIDHIGLQSHTEDKTSGNINWSVHETNHQFAIYFVQLVCLLFEIGFEVLEIYFIHVIMKVNPQTC